MGTGSTVFRRPVALVALGVLVSLSAGGEAARGAPQGTARAAQPKAGLIIANIATGQ